MGRDKLAMTYSLACLLLPNHRYSMSIPVEASGGQAMNWKTLLAYITGSVDQELLRRNEYLVTENRTFHRI
jgi:hypothetical protein